MTTAAVCTILATAPHAAAQTTPAAASEMDTLIADVWTCPHHEQFRMTASDVCPICGMDLVRRKITLQGPDAAGDPYPLDTCPVSGKELGSMGMPVVMMHEGREVRFCCKGCIPSFEKNAEKYLAQIDGEIVERQLPYYPMTTCPVSGEALGSMGEPVDYVYSNRLVRLCCQGCLRSLKKDPDKYLGKLNEAILAQQGAAYPMKSCVISKQKLGSMGEPVDYVVASRLVRFCCGGCAGTFNRAPAAHLATIDKAWKRAGGMKGGHAPKGKSHEGKSHEHDHDHGHDHDHPH
jgi:YHS domain-containing protein